MPLPQLVENDDSRKTLIDSDKGINSNESNANGK